MTVYLYAFEDSAYFRALCIVDADVFPATIFSILEQCEVGLGDFSGEAGV